MNLVRTVWRCSLLGLVVGLVVGGVGSRLAMRIVALTNDEFTGFLTDAGEQVGEISAGGTSFLLFAGAFFGTFGGAAYALLRAWLPRQALLRALVFGLGLLALTFLADRLAPGELGPLRRSTALVGGAAIAVFIAAGLAQFGATVAELV